MNETDKLLQIKEAIEKAKTDKAQAEGRLEELMKRLKKDFDCKDLISAEKKLKRYDKEITTTRKQLDDGIAMLKGAYDGW